MRILLVSDIHGNAAALAAVQERYDVAVCLGDVVEYGPDPGPCVAWVRERCRYAVRGNHDHGAAQYVAAPPGNGFKYLTAVTRRLTAERLDRDDRRFLARLPTSTMVTLDGRRFLFVHASPRDPLDEYVPTDEEEWAARLGGLPVDFLCVGHTHQQFALQVGRTTVVNPGAVGLQRDGDPRVRYAVIDAGRLELRAAEYDIEAAVAAVDTAPIEPAAKALLGDIYRTGRYAKPGDVAHHTHANGLHRAASLNGHHAAVVSPRVG